MAKTKADLKRELLREEFWPEHQGSVWGGPAEKGYWCAPRVLPLFLDLAASKSVVGDLDCSKVYLELLSRDFGQGVVEILDEEEHAFCAGYRGKRAKRTWQERIRRLEGSGFIQVQPKGNRTIGYVLIIHPYKVATELRNAGKVDDLWWQLFKQKLNAVGAGETLSKFEEITSSPAVRAAQSMHHELQEDSREEVLR
jgi:hypothetical protein